MCYFSGPRSLQTCQHSFEVFFPPFYTWLLQDFGSFIPRFFSLCIPFPIFFSLHGASHLPPRDASPRRAALHPLHTRGGWASSSNGSTTGWG